MYTYIKTHRAKTIILLCGICCVVAVTAQVIPKEYPGNFTINYVRTWASRMPETDPVMLKTKTARDVTQTTVYFEGLGRQLQTVIRQGSLETAEGTLIDLVKPTVYDEMGRRQYQYLPFPANNNSNNNSISDGNLKLNPFQQQAGFYSDPNGVLKGQGETYYYSKINFEASPLSRIEKIMPPGNSWVGSGRGTESKYWFNTVIDDVKKWVVTDVINGWGTYNITGAYPANELYKNVTVDEHGKQVVEFEDKEGKIILKKAQFTAAADNGTGSDYTGWLCTYYIYDDLGNLRCMVQPEGVKSLAAGGWSLTTTLLREQCFRYEYDERNRIVMKKVPGAGEIWMVYDARDRLVLTQDANLRAQGKWLYMLYNNDFNRPVSTGLWANVNDRIYHKGSASSSIGYPNLSGQTYEELTTTFYDSYDWLAQNGNPLPSSYNNSYDTYFQPNNNNWPYPQANNQSPLLKGMVTGSRVKILGTGVFLYTISFYDGKGRVIQMQSTNLTGGLDIITTQYTWAGAPLVTVQKQQKSGSNPQITVIVTQHTYDDLGRLVRIEKKQSNTLVDNNSMSGYKTISQLEYNKLGQLKNKKLSPSFNGGAGLETLGYDYNIRGWILGLNRNYLKDNNAAGYAGNYFGFELGYDKTLATPGCSYSYGQFNGNIAGTIWKSKGDQVRRKYDFEYDPVNRFGKASFSQNTSPASGGSWSSAEANFSVGGFDADNNYQMKYDCNGNIQTMIQHGIKNMNPDGHVDALRYTYQPGSNKLDKVIDEWNDPNTKLGDFKDGSDWFGTDYRYDDNGNLTLDNNKSISSITYNHLNLPSVISVTGKGTIIYIYDAAGNKLQKVTTENNATVSSNGTNYTGNVTTTTTYIGNTVYESKSYSNAALSSLNYTDQLQFIAHEEGRIRFKPVSGSITPGWQYDYFIRDHLGNVRMVLTEEQQQDQYPATTLEGNTGAGALSMINYEKQFYTINNTYVVSSNTLPGWNAGKDYQNNNGNPPPNVSYPASTTPSATELSTKIYQLNGSVNKTGLGIVLKVMVGDKIDIHGKSYYQSATTYDNGNSTLLTLADMIGAFIGAPDNAGFGGKGVSSGTMQTVNTGLIPPGFFRGNDGTSSSIPKAYINYIFFDEQFKYAGGGFSRAGNSGTVKDHWFTDEQLRNIPVPKNGYLYVYVSNESNANVFFDNLQVFHTRGPVLEETHYYPFGLAMAGISSKALNRGNAENKKKFNGYEQENKEFSDGGGLEWYDYKNRFYDNQVGRFFCVDRLTDKYPYYSPYQFAGNEVPNAIDLDGLEPFYRAFQYIQSIQAAKKQGETERWYLNARKLMEESWAKKNSGEKLPEISSPPTLSAVAPPPPLSASQKKLILIDRVMKLSPVGIVGDLMARGPVNDAFITLKAMGSGIFGYDKAGMTDMYGNVVGYNKRIAAGINTFTTPVIFANPEGQVARIAEEGSSSAKVMIGENMSRVEAAGWKYNASIINMPDHMAVSEMMQYDRQWFLQQLKDGKTILDIGIDPGRPFRSIFHETELNMMNNYRRIHPDAPFKYLQIN